MRQIKTPFVEKMGIDTLMRQLEGVFSMGTKASYPAEVKM